MDFVSSIAAPTPSMAAPATRLLTHRDIPELLALEADKWTAAQSASPDTLAERIDTHPELSAGAFCPHSGHIVASLFMKPVSPDFWKHAPSWKECADGATPLRTRSLFGISLSSRHASGVQALLQFLWPLLLAAGWRDIYLGSPLPGWSTWRREHPGRSIVDYVRLRGPRGLPIDPQLRYYRARGFKDIVCVKRNYFPHERSEDHGVILRGTVPLSSLAPVWRALPLAATKHITRRVSSLLL